MKFLKCTLLLMLFPLILSCQEITGEELLNRSIHYHDPQGNWERFSASFSVTMQTPKASPRYSNIKIDLPEEYFSLKARRDSVVTSYTIDKGKCTTTMTDSTGMKRSPCETAELYRNYYTYLYGLPMKLKDPGANIDGKVVRKNFRDKDYLVLKVTYDENIGSDVWYFYFDPSTYAMEVYQFFKGDPLKEGKDTGEFILLSEEKLINGIRMPKVRAWYYNKNDEYLGTDTLN
jgi:hypothetical protein